MRITSIEGYAMSSPIDPPQERSFHAGNRRLLKRDVVLAVVETASGERGFAPAGASSSAMREYFEGDSQGTFADVLSGPVAAALVGETVDDPHDIHTLVESMNLSERLRTEVISAVDVAVWDLVGKERGAPVYELLAERFETEPTETLPLYASAGMYMDPDGYVEQAKILEELGFFGYKYRPGIGPEADRQTIDRLMESIDIEVMVDAHTWWKMNEHSYGEETVASLVEHAGESGVYWVEEPVAPDDYAGYESLAGRGVALAGGESEETVNGLLELGRTGAVDFLQGDVRHHRGVTGCWEAVEFCAGSDVTFVPHNFGTWLGLVANAHVVAAAPESELLEYPVFTDDAALEGDADPGMYPFDLAFDVLEESLDVTDGVLSVPDRPGLGVDVNLDVVDDYPFVDGPWTEFEYAE